MLGKVFEELVTGRHDSGAYYTPRPVVSFMCREALKGYIASRHPELDDASVTAFVDDRQGDVLPRSVKASVATSLDEVTAVDPACGSGAYLLGMLQELIALRDALFNESGEADPRDEYQRKLHIIGRNLYGADIDKFAVNIAMLRLWLSLAIDYEGDDPPPLPNLDFKVAVGDTLLAPSPERLDQDRMFIEQSGIGELKDRFMRAHGASKETLRQQVKDAKEYLRRNIPESAHEGAIVDWRVDFAEVIGKGGFDIVVANPPYVRQEQIASKAELVRLYSDAVTARSDLYCHFYARGLQLLRDGGMHVFVCSNSWLDVGYGAKLQEHLLSAASVEAIYESAVERQFSTAQINTIVSVIRKGGADEDRDTRFISLHGEFDSAIADAGLRREITMSRLQLTEAGLGGADSRGRRKYVGDKWGGKYLRAPDIYHHIMNTRADRLIRLGDIATVRFGIKTGANAFFYLTPERIAEFGIEDEYLRPVMTSPQESRSIAVDAATLPKRLFMCHADKDELTGTGALEYINWGESQGYHRRSSVRSRRRWYDLGRRDQVHLGLGKFANTTVRTFLNPSGILFTDNFQIMAFQDDVQSASLCAALNSTLCQLMFNISARSNFGRGCIGNPNLRNRRSVHTEPNATIRHRRRHIRVQRLGRAHAIPRAPSARRRHIRRPAPHSSRARRRVRRRLRASRQPPPPRPQRVIGFCDQTGVSCRDKVSSEELNGIAQFRPRTTVMGLFEGSGARRRRL